MAKSFNELMKDRFVKISTDYDKVNTFVHETAVLIAKHAEEHRDCSTAQGLVMAMPASIRREMLILWFSKFTPIVVKNDDSWTAKMHPADSKMYVPFDVAAGEKTPFTALAKSHKERPPLDLAGLILAPRRLAKQLESRIEDGGISDEEIETAKALISQLKGIRVQHIEATKTEDAEAPAGGEGETKGLSAPDAVLIGAASA